MPIATPAIKNDITVIDRRGYLSEIHSAVFDPMNEPHAHEPSTVT